MLGREEDAGGVHNAGKHDGQVRRKKDCWLFVISFDVLAGKSVCGFRCRRGWSVWIGIWTMSTCRRVVIANMGRFSCVLKVKEMACAKRSDSSYAAL